MGLFWLLVVAAVLPQAMAITQKSVHHLLRPAHEARAALDHDLGAVYLDRGVRALLLLGGAVFLAWVWRINLVAMTPTVQVAGRQDTEPAAARQVLTLIKGKPPEEGG
jgi:hypothetical protein